MIDTQTSDPLVPLAEIAEIELVILKRMKALTLGDHASVFKGPGFNLVGLRDWEPGDGMASIDWAQSSLNNFSPLITREFEQDSHATVVAVADASLSTRCGVGGAVIGAAIARAVATVGLSAALLQDPFGLITLDGGCRPLGSTRPRIGKPHVLHCLDLYQHRRQTEQSTFEGDLGAAIGAHLRHTSLVPVISDFLFERAPDVVQELSKLSAAHDVFLVLADARFAYQLPEMADGWIRTFDVETGSTRMLSRREFGQLSHRIETWQDEILRLAKNADLDAVRVGLDRWEMESTLASLVAERRLRRI